MQQPVTNRHFRNLDITKKKGGGGIRPMSIFFWWILHKHLLNCDQVREVLLVDSAELCFVAVEDWLSKGPLWEIKSALYLTPDRRGNYLSYHGCKGCQCVDIYLLNSDKYFLVDCAMFCLLVATPRLADHPLLPHQLLQQHTKGDLQQGIYD